MVKKAAVVVGVAALTAGCGGNSIKHVDSVPRKDPVNIAACKAFERVMDPLNELLSMKGVNSVFQYADLADEASAAATTAAGMARGEVASAMDRTASALDAMSSAYVNDESSGPNRMMDEYNAVKVNVKEVQRLCDDSGHWFVVNM